MQTGNVALLDVIDAGMAEIGAEDRLRIARVWASGQRAEDGDSIIIAVDGNYPPFSSIGIDGKPQGLLIDIWREWSQTIDRPVRFRVSNWEQTLQALRDGEADIHFGLFRSQEREAWLGFSQPLHLTKTALYAKDDVTDYDSLSQLSGKQVAAVAGTYQENYLRTNHPEIELVSVADRDDYLIRLLRGDIAAFVDEVPTVSAALSRFGVAGIVKRGNDLFSNEVRAGVLKDSTDLLPLIDTGMDRIPRDRLAEIEARWIDNPEDRFFSARNGSIELTQAERDWIADHPVIRLAPDPDFLPLEFFDEDGEYSGIIADLIRLAAKRTGLTVRAQRYANWQKAFESLANGESDVLPGMYEDDATRELLTFTSPHLTLRTVIVSTSESQGSMAIEDFYGKKVTVVEGWPQVDWLATNHPEIEIVIAEDTVDGLNKVSFGDADALISLVSVAAYYIADQNMAQLRIAGGTDDRTPIAVAIRKDWPELRDIFQKGLDSITQEERQEILQRWIPIDVSAAWGSGVELTPKERAWVASHPDIRLGIDPAWPPFEFVDEDGAYGGLSSGYVEAVSRRLGLSIQPVPDLTWTEVLAGLREGRVDILPAIARTPEREAYLDFTEPYITLQTVIATRKDFAYVGGLSDLADRSVAVVKGYAIEETLRRDYGAINLAPMESVAEGLSAIENGTVDAVVGDPEVISRAIDRLGLENVKIAAPTDIKIPLSMGVRKDWPELVVLLNKALADIGDKERSAIRNTWLAVQVSFGFDLKTILTWAIPIGTSAIAIVLFVVVWNQRLAREVAERKAAERKLSDAYGVITDSIQYASRIQRSILPNAALMGEAIADHFVIWEPRDVVGGDVYWVRRWGAGVTVILGDCTGHGVPGAFMTLIATGALDVADQEVQPGDVGMLLQKVHAIVQSNLGQHEDGGESDDGLELGICYLPDDRSKVVFGGARFDLFVVGDGAVKRINGTRKGIGYRRIPHNQEYEAHDIVLADGEALYMTTDGMIDQVGGPKRRAFGRRRFEQAPLEIPPSPMPAQGGGRLYETLKNYQGAEIRRDDVSVIGFRVG